MARNPVWTKSRGRPSVWARLWHAQIIVEGRHLRFDYKRGGTHHEAVIDLRDEVTPEQVAQFLVRARLGQEWSSTADVMSFSRCAVDESRARRLLKFLLGETERLPPSPKRGGAF